MIYELAKACYDELIEAESEALLSDKIENLEMVFEKIFEGEVEGLEYAKGNLKLSTLATIILWYQFEKEIPEDNQEEKPENISFSRNAINAVGEEIENIKNIEKCYGDNPGLQSKVEEMFGQNYTWNALDVKKLLALSSFCLNRLGSALKQASQGPRLRPTVEPGSKVERALAREVALFGTKAKTLQAYKLVNNQIMCRKPKGVSNHGGAIIVLIDISDSMNMNINIDGFGNSRRIEAAQAIAFSIMRFAQKQKRRIEIVTFNTYANKLNDQQKEILAFKQLNCNGGTINDVAISEAKRIIHDEKLNEPTIINITDGFVGEIREDTKNMNMYTVVIEFGASPSNLEDKSNKIFRFNEIGDKAFETMAQAFKGL